jgi:CBS domain containing-hemolysin-like protein
MSEGLAILFLVLLLGGNAFFVAAEFAMVSARRDQIEPRAAAGSGAAKIALKGIEDVSTSLAATQLGITACSLLIGAVGEPAIAHLIEGPMADAGVPEGLVHPVALVIALLVVTFFHMVIGEMVPKNMAIARPAASALLLGPVLRVFVLVFRPFIWLMNQSANLVVRYVFKAEPRDEALVGYVHTKDLLATPAERRHAPVPQEAVRRLATVPADAKLRRVMRSMQQRNAHLALVEGRGTTAGEVSVVALEDVLEELVGEVRDATSTSA